MRRVLVGVALSVGWFAALGGAMGCSSDDSSNDSCSGVGGVCVASSAQCTDNLPYTCNSGVCCASSSSSSGGSTPPPSDAGGGG